MDNNNKKTAHMCDSHGAELHNLLKLFSWLITDDIRSVPALPEPTSSRSIIY